MRKHGILVAMFAFVVCSAFTCTGTQIHKFKLANTDLSSGLARLTATVIQLNQQGVLTQAEATAILPKVSDATVLSDKMELCANAVSAKNTLVGCAAPLLTAIRDDMTQVSLGIKSPGAQAAMTSAINVAVAAVNQISKLGGAQ